MAKNTIFILLSAIFLLQSMAYTDTVYLKNGEEKKGIVVEEYVDRIKLNTVDGETQILKADIKDILYDLPVQNLIKLGDFHKQKGNLARAYAYYRKAYEADPNFEAAVERYRYISSILLQSPHEKLEQQIEKQKIISNAARGIIETKEAISAVAQEQLKNILGIELMLKQEKPYVSQVFYEGAAYKSGIRQGDYIIAVWNRLTPYMELEELCDIILKSKTGEVKLTIERAVTLAGSASTGMALDITARGLTVTRIPDNSSAKNSGLLESDAITKIADKPTRYMPLNEATALIESPGKDVAITINRDVTVWMGRG